MMTRSWTIAILAALTFGCSYPETDAKDAAPTPEAGTTDPPKEGEASTSSSVDPRLKITDTKVGTGREAKGGNFVYVTYTGTLMNGTQFDSNAGGDKGPFMFLLGSGQVIKGWDMGVAGMKVGGKRDLVIPADLAYGDRESGPIPANSDLKFTVELHEVLKPEDRNTFQLKTVNEGTGKKAANGDTIEVDYVGRLVNGMEFDSNAGKPPLKFEIGAGTVVPGFDAGVVGTQEGGEYTLWIGPDAAYGPQSRGKIPADSVLIFELKVRKLADGKGAGQEKGNRNVQ